jgi:group I intron endonuclease
MNHNILIYLWFFFYMKTGIYKILNTVNNKVYIGSATHIEKRWRDHKWYLNHNIHHNSHLQSAWNKYGIKVFEFSILLECSIDELLDKEKEYTLKYNSLDNNYGYNVNEPRKIFLNRKCSQEIKELASKRMLGENNPMYGKFGKQHPKFNMKMSEENRKLISDKAKKRRGDDANNSKLTEKDVIEIRDKYKNDKYTQRELSLIYNVTQVTISNIIIKKSWSHI